MAIGSNNFSIWCDFIERDFLRDGLPDLVDSGVVSGVTSNPVIFKNAIISSAAYENDKQKSAALLPIERYELIAIEDIREAAKLLLPTHNADEHDGFVSIEVNPLYANDSAKMTEEAKRLWRAINMPNVMLKIPATTEGYESIKDLIIEGINVNATLVFSPLQAGKCLQAIENGFYIFQRRNPKRKFPQAVISVFVSRFDRKLDGILEKAGMEKMKFGIMNASYIYHLVKEQKISNVRCLFASTGVSSDSVKGSYYITKLLYKNAINTAPIKAIDSFMDNLDTDERACPSKESIQEYFDEVEEKGVNLKELYSTLLTEGLEQFNAAFKEMIASFEEDKKPEPLSKKPKQDKDDEDENSEVTKRKTKADENKKSKSSKESDDEAQNTDEKAESAPKKDDSAKPKIEAIKIEEKPSAQEEEKAEEIAKESEILRNAKIAREAKAQADKASDEIRAVKPQELPSEKIQEIPSQAKPQEKENIEVNVKAEIPTASAKPAVIAKTPKADPILPPDPNEIPAVQFLRKCLQNLVDYEGSDLHIKSDSDVKGRVNGEIVTVDSGIFTKLDMEILAEELLGDRYDEFLRRKNIDFVYKLNKEFRFRVNMFFQTDGISAAFRVIPLKLPTVELMELPSVIKNFATKRRGLILVTGPTGCGKSTTLATMINLINQTSQRHIITIEDPIEFIYKDEQSIINQRSVGQDAISFADALVASLREDPDVIMVGEMRDIETIRTAIRAAETGHLVFSTLHTLDAKETIGRIISMFDGNEQKQIRQSLSSVLEAVVSQRLVRRKGSRGRVAAVEILVKNARIEALIAQGRESEIKDAIETDRDVYQSQSFNQALLDLYSQGIINYHEALYAATSPADLKIMLDNYDIKKAKEQKAGSSNGKVYIPDIEEKEDEVNNIAIDLDDADILSLKR